MQTEDVPVAKLRIGDRMIFDGETLRIDATRLTYSQHLLNTTNLEDNDAKGHVVWDGEFQVKRIVESQSEAAAAATKPRQLRLERNPANAHYYVHETTDEGELEVARFVLKRDADLFVATVLFSAIANTPAAQRILAEAYAE